MTVVSGYVQEGAKINYPNSSGSDISYLEVIVPSSVPDKIFIAAEAIEDGETGVVYTEGVFQMPAINDSAFVAGEEVYWDAAAGKVTNVATDNVSCGWVTEAKAETGATANVKINEHPHSDSLVGDLADLTTTEQSTIVGAINEVDAKVAANVAANASTPATCTTTPAVTISVEDATTLTTAIALVNICKARINTLIVENAVLKASIADLITENATFKVTINAEIAALKAAGLQASS